MSILFGPDGRPIRSADQQPRIVIPLNRAQRRAQARQARAGQRLSIDPVAMASAFQRAVYLHHLMWIGQLVANQASCARYSGVDVPEPAPPIVERPWSPEQIATIQRANER